jgi:hypothetical protein
MTPLARLAAAALSTAAVARSSTLSPATVQVSADRAAPDLTMATLQPGRLIVRALARRRNGPLSRPRRS